jgi:hypothetical protein
MAVTGTGTGVYTLTASDDIATGLFILNSIRWVGATAAGEQCIVMDEASHSIFIGEADGANFTDGWVFDRLWCNNPRAKLMDSGTLQIYMSAR